MKTSLLALALVLFSHPNAYAASACVTVNEKMDNLTPSDRRASAMVMMQVLQEEGISVSADNTNCQENYSISSVQLGKRITVNVSGPKGQRTGQASRIDELSSVISQIVKSLVRGSTDPVLDRRNVVEDQMAPKRQPAESITYASSGYGFLVRGDSWHDGPSLSVGHRWELDRIGLGMEFGSFFSNVFSNLVREPNRDVSFSFWLNGRFSYFFSPMEDRSFFVGAGPGVSTTYVQQSGDDAKGLGFHGNVHAGYEMLRTSTIRCFIQFDTFLPFYFTRSGGEDKFTPIMLLSIGGGYGKSPTETSRTIIHD